MKLTYVLGENVNNCRDVPEENGRFLGAVSGMAEAVNNTVVFCRHASCWRLDVLRNRWHKVGGFTTQRVRAASVALNNQVIVLGGRDDGANGMDIVGFEIFDSASDSWVQKPEWSMAQGRYRYYETNTNQSAAHNILETLFQMQICKQLLCRPNKPNCIDDNWGIFQVGASRFSRGVGHYYW